MQDHEFGVFIGAASDCADKVPLLYFIIIII